MCCEAMTEGQVCCFLWAVLILKLLLLAVAAVCVYQMQEVCVVTSLDHPA